jgi:hypothetical protein
VALTPTGIYSGLASARASGTFAFGGVPFDQLAQGLASGICTWGISQPQNLALVGAATGTAGAGAILPVTTKLIVPPNMPAMLAGLSGAVLVGPLGLSLATVVTTGLATVFTAQAQYMGTAAGVGVGADISKILVANSASLAAILMGTLGPALGGGGPALPMFASGLAAGISALLLGGTGTGSVTGSPSTAPGAGVTNSVVV